MLTTRFASATDTGNLRPQNEDSAYCDAQFFVVADGMGGHNAGEIASAIACTKAAEATRDGRVGSLEDLARFVTDANAAIFDAATTTTGQHGMGTTITALAIFDGPTPTVGVANVGDSRTYLLRGGQLQQVSVDHSYVQELIVQGYVSKEEARTHPQRNIVTRALGIDRAVNVDTFLINSAPGDRFMLCSDGLVDEIDDATIETIMRTTSESTDCARALVTAAKAAGGRDNITVVVVDLITAPVDTSTSPLVPSVSGDLVGGLVVLALFALLVVVGVWRSARDGYSVVFEDDTASANVVVLNGPPDGVWWFDPSIKEVSPLTRSQLLDAFVADIERVRTFDSLEDARRFVDGIAKAVGSG